MVVLDTVIVLFMYSMNNGDDSNSSYGNSNGTNGIVSIGVK